jgi:hypothetical protein
MGQQMFATYGRPQENSCYAEPAVVVNAAWPHIRCLTHGKQALAFAANP